MTPPALPSRLVLAALLNGAPVQGAWFALSFAMRSKNAYRLLFGPSSSSGEYTVNRDQLLTEARNVQNLFLLDYDDLSRGWTGELEARTVNRSDIARVLHAYDTYGESGVYPSDLVQDLTRFDADLSRSENGELSVRVVLPVGEEARVVLLNQNVD